MTLKYSDSVKRSIAKTLSWRLVVIVSDSVVVYALTHRIALALSVMAATNLASVLLYYIHERVWNGMTWGRRKR